MNGKNWFTLLVAAFRISYVCMVFGCVETRHFGKQVKNQRASD
jgi:hypothetical protein